MLTFQKWYESQVEQGKAPAGSSHLLFAQEAWDAASWEMRTACADLCEELGDRELAAKIMLINGGWNES